MFKTEQTLIGQGEAARKRAVMQADGALDKKLEAWVTVNEAYTAEIGKQQWIPNVQIGGGSSNGAQNATDLIDLLKVKTAKDLSLGLLTK